MSDKSADFRLYLIENRSIDGHFTPHRFADRSPVQVKATQEEFQAEEQFPLQHKAGR